LAGFACIDVILPTAAPIPSMQTPAQIPSMHAGREAPRTLIAFDAEGALMFRKLLISAGAIGLVVATSQARQGQSLADLKTTAEASGYQSTSSYEDVVRFMKAVDAASPLVHYTTYGKTFEGRDMPLAVVGTGLKDASAAGVRASGRLRVHIQGNIHAGEVEGKESAQVLLREFALGQHADWLRNMVFIITPIYNADGNEKMATNNRGSQNGPINGQGTRAQAQNINLNRDYMKLDTPEGKASAKLWVDYDPHVGYDLHTSNGSCHAYHLTYSPPLNPNTSDLIMQIMKNEWFPAATKAVFAKHQWHMFYYGNTQNREGECPGGGRRGGGAPGAAGGAGAAQQTPTPTPTPAPEQAKPRSWGTFEHVPRFHNNYVGLRNRFALLSEAYSYATFEDRIKVTNYFMEETLTWLNANIAKVRNATAAADKEVIVGKSLATRAAIKSGGLVEILMGAVDQETNPVSGRSMNRRRDVVKPEMMTDRMWFEGTKFEDVPAEYYIPAAAKTTLELLRTHGIQMRVLTAPVKGVEVFTITSNTARPAGNSIDLGTHPVRTIDGSWAASTETVPAGAFAVPMNQPLARLAFYLIAPTSDDGLVFWNYLDEMLGSEAKTFPIARKK
jgi:hypothetical protein